jgi:hypothetical protein
MLQILVPFAAGLIGRELIERARKRSMSNTQDDDSVESGRVRPDLRRSYNCASKDYRVRAGEAIYWEGNSPLRSIDALLDARDVYPETPLFLERRDENGDWRPWRVASPPVLRPHMIVENEQLRERVEQLERNLNHVADELARRRLNRVRNSEPDGSLLPPEDDEPVEA